MVRALLLVCLFCATPAFAFHDTACAEKVWLAKGLFRKYELKYSTVDYISCKASTDESSIEVSTKSTLQNSTASLDPGITTGQAISTTQYSLSFGDCSGWADNQNWVKRETYVAENMGQIRKDVALGNGEYIETIAYLSGCPASAKESFAKLLHNHYDSLFRNSEGWRFGSDVDALLREDSGLKHLCELYPQSTIDS
jgi:hypothetical protein